ncbi:MAG: Mu-like prophage major head subunit gpT family protein [Methylocystis sp.]
MSIFDDHKKRIRELNEQATAKLAELKDGISADDARAIENAHDALCVQLADAKRALREAEHKNLREIGDHHGCRRLVDEAISAGDDENLIRNRVLNWLVEEQDKQGGPKGTSSIGIDMGTFENPDFRRRACEDALYARLAGKPPQNEAARALMGKSLLELDSISSGRRSYLDSGYAETRGGYLTTSDFPNLTLGAGQRFLQETYTQSISPVFTLARQMQANDFRKVNVLRLSEAPALEEVMEAGEITHGARGEEAEGFSVKTFAKIFALSRQVIVNDDLGSFSDALSAFARAAAETANNQIVGLLTANSGNGANLSDGNPLFHTSHANKAASGTVIDVAGLAAARRSLRDTKGIDGVTPINMAPRYLLVGSAKETEAESVLSTLIANQLSNVNPFSGKLELLVEPRLTGNAWRVFADTTQQSVIRYAYLQGRSGPLLETRPGWTTLGQEFRAVLDIGVGVTDWRGAYLNAGA